VVVLLHDVTEVRGLAREMSYQATHDALTGLLNRHDFERRLQDAIDIAHRGDSTHVLCYLDLDRFKTINDSSGHQAGDAMLREAAKLLRDAVRDSDIVARIGGDEFGILLVGCPLDKARQIADDVYRAVKDFRFVWKDRIFNVGVSIGLVEIGHDSGSIEELLASADSACYVAKRQGGHVAVYSARDEAFARQSGEFQWLQTLQAALRDNRFEQMTLDHSLLQELVDRGFYSQQEAQRATNKNYVTRALGVEQNVEVEIHEQPVQKSDYYVLCSDGLSDMIEDEDIHLTISTFSANLDTVAKQLIQLSNDNGGRDNVSVIMAQVIEPFPAHRRIFDKILGWFG